MNNQLKSRKKRRDRLRRRYSERIRLIKEAETRLKIRKLKQKLADSNSDLSPVFSSKDVNSKIADLEAWLEQLRKLKVNENTDIEKEEITLLIRTMLKELMRTSVPDKTVRIINHRVNEVIQQKRKEIANLKRQIRKQRRKEQKQLNRELDLKHYEGSIAEKLLELVSERKVENKPLIITLLDRLWRKSMSGGMLSGKDFEAISAAKDFLRTIDSLSP